MQIYNLDFTEQQIREAVAAGKLLSMEIEFSRICNFRCSYCYVDAKIDRTKELSLVEIRDVILQAKDLGARKIIILGGEPSVYPHLTEMVRFLSENEFAIEMFTNGSGIGKELAAALAEYKARIVLKMNSRDEKIQDKLVGNKCMHHQVSFVVTAVGEVMPCVGVTIALGNIRRNKLAHILKNSEVVKNLKNYRQMIKGECKSCEKAAECYGRRGAAYQLTGDYLAGDPTCWRHSACIN